jgi:hypothetical protein
MPIYKYQRQVTAGPNGTTLYFRNTDASDAVELADVADWHYVFVPDAATMPVQHAAIDWQLVTLDAALKEQIKAASRPCHLIADRMQSMIRGVYSLEDEQYFSRIGVGAALGAYEFQAGEHGALLAFGQHVEDVRTWGRGERAKVGL